MGEFKSLLRKTSDDYHGPRSLPLVGKFGEVSYAPRGRSQKTLEYLFRWWNELAWDCSRAYDP